MTGLTKYYCTNKSCKNKYVAILNNGNCFFCGQKLEIVPKFSPITLESVKMAKRQRKLKYIKNTQNNNKIIIYGLSKLGNEISQGSGEFIEAQRWRRKYSIMDSKKQKQAEKKSNRALKDRKNFQLNPPLYSINYLVSKLKEKSPNQKCIIRRKFKLDLVRGAICCVCRKEANYLHHIVQLDNGGSNKISNLVPLCTSCYKSILQKI